LDHSFGDSGWPLFWGEVTSFNDLSTVCKTDIHTFNGIRFVLQFLIPSWFCSQCLTIKPLIDK
jgi:hypothetical protein